MEEQEKIDLERGRAAQAAIDALIANVTLPKLPCELCDEPAVTWLVAVVPNQPGPSYPRPPALGFCFVHTLGVSRGIRSGAIAILAEDEVLRGRR